MVHRVEGPGAHPARGVGVQVVPQFACAQPGGEGEQAPEAEAVRLSRLRQQFRPLLRIRPQAAGPGPEVGLADQPRPAEALREHVVMEPRGGIEPGPEHIRLAPVHLHAEGMRECGRAIGSRP